jgi:hypothetical protein
MQDDNIYKMIEVVGSSHKSYDDAIKTGISKAAKSVAHIRWFQVMETRGHVENDEVAHFQVVMKVGFRVDE